MANEDQNSPQEHPNRLADLMKKHGYAGDAIEKRREAQEGIGDAPAAGAAKEQAAQLPNISSHMLANGQSFFTEKTEAEIEKTRKGPPMLDGHPVSEKEFAAHQAASKPQRLR